MARTLDRNRLDEIGRALDLAADKREELTAMVVRIGETIAAHRTAMQSRLPRHERNKALRGISKALVGLERELTLLAGHDGGTLSRICAAILAHQLSNAGIEAGLGRAIYWPDPSIHLLESREAESREGPYRVLEAEHYHPAREGIMRTQTPEVLQGLFRRLQQRVDAFLALDREHSKGGAQGKPYRKHVIAVLATAFPSLFSIEPTGSPNGKFCTLCELVLTELGENTEGIETAIQRFLRKNRS
jgi:hypothetical protein